MLNLARRAATAAVCACVLIVSIPGALAQDTGKKKAPAESKGVESKDAGVYANLSFGRLLPYDVYGVRDIYPYWGLRFGHPFGGAGAEWSTAIVHAKGVKYYDFAASLAFPSELESWKFIPFVGADVHYYSGKTDQGSVPYSSSLGFHMGVSPILEFGPLVSLRADFKFNFNPGRSLHVGAGFQFAF